MKLSVWLAGLSVVAVLATAQHSQTLVKKKAAPKANAKASTRAGESMRRKASGHLVKSRRGKRPSRPVSPEARASALSQVSERMTAAESHIENASALEPFFSRLEVSRQNSPQPVHILQFGDSHTASDDWVDAMRQIFQSRFGVGGPGYVMPGRPFKGYRRFDSKGDSSAGWETEGTTTHPGDGRTGLGGISITAGAPGRMVGVTTSSEELVLLYLQQPGGGVFTVECDGSLVDTVNTDGAVDTGAFRLTPQPGEHTWTIRTRSYGPVRLFGWIPENKSGVTWETLGINGAQAAMILGWDPSLWARQIALRDPGLIVLAYGTNEANSRTFAPETYHGELLELVARFRRAAPNAALLMVGPPDCGRSRPLLHLDEVIEIQRAVARASGVSFWDWREHMGGPRSITKWVRAGLGQADHIHLTGSGYRLLGQTLAEEIDGEYRRHLAAKDERSAAASESHD